VISIARFAAAAVRNTSVELRCVWTMAAGGGPGSHRAGHGELAVDDRDAAQAVAARATVGAQARKREASKALVKPHVKTRYIQDHVTLVRDTASSILGVRIFRMSSS